MNSYRRKKFWSQIILSFAFAGYLMFWFFEGLNTERLEEIDKLGIKYGIGVQKQDASRIAFFQMVIPDSITETEFTQGERWIDVSQQP